MTTLREKAVEASNKRTELSAEHNTKWMPITSDDNEELMPFQPNDIEEKINPSHYTQGKIEVIDFILDQKMDYMTATITKYISRWRFKDGVCDLKKAQWFLNKLIKEEEK
jgi:hypothetical protein|tara:strand:- start:597 stop:926 length:330 start_codon:yes stop_codon:yes gene_type:complete